MQNKGEPKDNKSNKSAPGPKVPESKPKDFSTAILDRKKSALSFNCRGWQRPQ